MLKSINFTISVITVDRRVIKCVTHYVICARYNRDRFIQ